MDQNEIPRENLFLIGSTARGHSHDVDFFSFGVTRSPFIVDRREALNIIGYIIALGQWNPSDIDDCVKEVAEGIRPNVFGVDGNEARAIIQNRPKFPLFLFTHKEAKGIVGWLIHFMKIKPSEIDAAVFAIESQGPKTNEDALTTAPK